MRLVDALQEIDADIIALEEIENISVAHDIIKLLPFSSKLHYAVFA